MSKKAKKVNKSVGWHVRQGDVLILKVDSIPKNLVKKDGPPTLALGEVTGHHHTFNQGAVGYADSQTAQLSSYVEVPVKEATITHQEHEGVTIPEGTYKSVIQTEYEPESLRRVRD